jgi:hypothetical protein
MNGGKGLTSPVGRSCSKKVSLGLDNSIDQTETGTYSFTGHFPHGMDCDDKAHALAMYLRDLLWGEHYDIVVFRIEVFTCCFIGLRDPRG